MNHEELLSAIADNAPALITVYNIQSGQYVYVNKAITKILGYEPDDFINGTIEFSTSIVHPDDITGLWAKNNKAIAEANKNPEQLSSGEPIVSFEYRMKHKNGAWRWMRTEGTVFSRDKDGKVECILNISLNITDRKVKEDQLMGLKTKFEDKVGRQTKKLQQSEKMFRNLIQVIEDYAIFHLDPHGKVTTWNEGIAKILGYSEEEIVGVPMSILFTPKDQKEGVHHKELEKAKSEGTVTSEGIRVRKDGTTFYAMSTCTPIWDENGQLQGFSKIMRDVTELREAEETIRYHALHDTLTGLSNRKALDEHFQMAKSMSIRNGQKMAMMFMDLDRFKTINDTLGHGIGDLVLKEVAERLKKSIRQIDTVARLGGDEFIILINEVTSTENVARVAEKILESIRPVIKVQKHSLHLTASIGIALFPNDGQDIYSLLKNADTALYRAKDSGRNRHQFYDYSMNLQSINQLSLEQDLRTALAQNQLYLVYQPFIDIKTGKVKGVEALLRWDHPVLGTVLPFDFIPLAEETGIIVPIGKWIMKTVCEQGNLFKKAGFPLKMAINLSGRQFSEVELVSQIASVVKATHFDPRSLEVEITESVAMDNLARTSSKLNDLKDLGVSIAIDDFGTGYSSLSYLKRFPVQKLKIDKSFIKHAITDPQDTAIIRAIISMSKSLGLSVCAEGVEGPEQLGLLNSMDCDIAQGYYISKPMTADNIVPWLQAREQELEVIQAPIL